MNAKINLNKEYLSKLPRFDEFDLEDFKESEYKAQPANGADARHWVAPEQWDRAELFAANTNINELKESKAWKLKQ